jgi:hypothetical protein
MPRALPAAIAGRNRFSHPALFSGAWSAKENAMDVKKLAATLGSLILALALVSAAGAAQPPGARPAPEPAWDPAAVQVTPAGNAITYQGYLTDGGLPANGVYDFVFSLYADAAGTQWVTTGSGGSDLPVADGYFTARVDFTDAMYGDVHFYLNGEARWLGISVRPGASTGSYTALAPLQALTPAPYAQALPGLHTIQNTTSPNVVGGYPWNSVNVNAVGATISGGGSEAGNNAIGASYATVGGGFDNTANSLNSTVGGGSYNTANGTNGAVCGGSNNTAAGYAFVGGGSINWATGSSSTISGGGLNTAGGQAATISGGNSNSAAGQYATVPGGANNSAAGNYSLAAGRRAKANAEGSFVWADSTDADLTTDVPNRFLVRARAGAEIRADNISYGLLIDNDNTAGNGDGLRVYTRHSDSTVWAAVFAYNYGTSPAVYADSAGTYSGYFQDNIYVAGSCVGCTLVYLARNDGAEPLEEGDLVVATGVTALAGNESPVLRVRRAGTDGDAQQAIAGVVLERGVLVTSPPKEPAAEGGEPTAGPTEDIQHAEGPVAPGDYLFLVVQGVARVKVDASAGAITAGQRLAGAGLAGHARALRTLTVEGVLVAEGAATVGVALESLEAGTGLISVLVNLQ